MGSEELHNQVRAGSPGDVLPGYLARVLADHCGVDLGLDAAVSGVEVPAGFRSACTESSVTVVQPV